MEYTRKNSYLIPTFSIAQKYAEKKSKPQFKKMSMFSMSNNSSTTFSTQTFEEEKEYEIEQDFLSPKEECFKGLEDLE